MIVQVLPFHLHFHHQILDFNPKAILCQQICSYLARVHHLFVSGMQQKKLNVRRNMPGTVMLSLLERCKKKCQKITIESGNLSLSLSLNLSPFTAAGIFYCGFICMTHLRTLAQMEEVGNGREKEGYSYVMFERPGSQSHSFQFSDVQNLVIWTLDYEKQPISSHFRCSFFTFLRYPPIEQTGVYYSGVTSVHLIILLLHVQHANSIKDSKIA